MLDEATGVSRAASAAMIYVHDRASLRGRIATHVRWSMGRCFNEFMADQVGQRHEPSLYGTLNSFAHMKSTNTLSFDDNCRLDGHRIMP